MNHVPNHIRAFWLCSVMAGVAVGLVACAADYPDSFEGDALAWSPDGQWIVFTSDIGGTPGIELYALNVADALDGASRDSWLYLSQGFADVIDVGRTNWLLAWSPDGQRITFTSGDTVYAFDAACLDAPDTCADSLTRLLSGATTWHSLVWSPDSTRLLVESSTGEPYVPSAGGAYVEGEVVYVMRVVVADGSQDAILTREAGPGPEAGAFFPAWSPDGTQIVYRFTMAGQSDLFVLELDGGEPVQFTFTPADEFEPAWSPDGAEIAYWSHRDLCRQALDGGPPACVTYDTTPYMHNFVGGPHWSADGAMLAITVVPAERGLFNRDPADAYYLISPDGTGPLPILEPGGSERRSIGGLAWSPDGTRLAFCVYTSRGRERWADIYLIDADGSGLTNLTD